MQNNQVLASNNNTDDTKKYFSTYKSEDDPESILKEVADNLDKRVNIGMSMVLTSDCKAASLFEFDNGILMTDAIPDKYRTIAIELSRRLQTEYNCKTVGEKALTELAAMNYVRYLDMNERILSSLTTIKSQSYRHDSCLKADDPLYAGNPSRTACQRTALELKLLTILTRSIDQAGKAYLSALHSLNFFRQPALKINIKTQNNIVGQNQFVQANSHA